MKRDLLFVVEPLAALLDERRLEKVDAVRLELAIQYRTRAWQTIDVDRGPAGVGAVDLVEPTIRGLSAMRLRT